MIMGIIGQFRAMRGVYRLRHQVLAAEDELAQSLGSHSGQPAGAGTTPSSPEIRQELAGLLREQADLLEVSLLARMITMLPPPDRLRADADRLEDPAVWDEEPGRQ
jgi:hypothetical protein